MFKRSSEHLHMSTHTNSCRIYEHLAFTRDFELDEPRFEDEIYLLTRNVVDSRVDIMSQILTCCLA